MILKALDLDVMPRLVAAARICKMKQNQMNMMQQHRNRVAVTTNGATTAADDAISDLDDDDDLSESKVGAAKIGRAHV